MIRIVAAVIVDGDGRILLVRKRGTRAFMQPGGKLAAGEAPLDALEREISEELGCTIEPNSCRALGTFSASAANEPGRTVEAQLFAVELAGDIAPAAEIEEARWHDPSRPAEIALAPLTRDCVLPLIRTILRRRSKGDVMTDRIEALERLQRLRESGALTEEEFAAEKAALLGRADAIADAALPDRTRSTTVVAGRTRRPDWLVPALVGAALLVFIAAAVLLLRGGGGADVDGAAVNVAAPVPEPEAQNEVAPAPSPGIRARSQAEQLAAAFEAAFGRPGSAVRRVEENEITYRPGGIRWIGDRAVLVSVGTNAEDCHACSGAIAVHYLEPQGEGFRVTGAWLDGGGVAGWGRAPDWAFDTALSGQPMLRTSSGDGGQGYFCSGTAFYEFGPGGPVEVAEVQTGYSNVGAIDTDSGAQGTQIEGELRNFVRGRSFDVVYTGTESFTEHYVRRGGRYVREAGETRVPTC